MRIDAGAIRRRIAARLLVIATGTAALIAGLALASQSKASFPPGENGRITFSGALSFNDPADIFVMNPDGSNRVNLTPGSALNDFNSVWSPNGLTVVFHRSPSINAGPWDLFTVNADGSNLAPLAATPGVDERQPDFSPDGQKVIFTRDPGTGDSDVAVVNVDGSGLTNLTPGNPGTDWQATFSPDGSRIAYASDRDGGDFDIFAPTARTQST